MKRGENYSSSWAKVTTLEPEMKVLSQEEKFNNERKKLNETKTKKRQISKLKKNLKSLNSEIRTLTDELGDDLDDYLYETTPKTKFEKTSYFAQNEPLDVDLLRKTISHVIASEEHQQAFENNLSCSEVSAKSIKINSQPQIEDTELDEKRRTSMLRLSQTARGLSSAELRSATKYETEMSIRDLQSKSFRTTQSRQRTSNLSSLSHSTRDFNTPAARHFPTVRKKYTPPSKESIRLPHQESSMVKLTPPTLNKTIYQKASIVCQESEEILARVLQE